MVLRVMDTPEALITRWLKGGSNLLAQLLDQHTRATAALEETRRECAKLQGEITSLREQHDRLQKGQSEVINTIAAALSTATAALNRVPDTPAIVSVTPLTTAAVSQAEVESGVAAVAPSCPSPPVALLPTAKPGGPVPALGPTPRRVLVVDDDESFRSMVAMHLGDQGYQVTMAASGEDALMLLETSPPQLVLLDLMMPGIGGMKTLRNIKAQHPDLSVLMVTGEGDLSIAQEALALGATDYIKKPFDLDYLDAVLQMYTPVSNARSAAVLSAMATTEQVRALTPTSPFRKATEASRSR
jgi:CheY-like chemotaxis protein